jgi:predicted naringenin-chalcone synthase
MDLPMTLAITRPRPAAAPAARPEAWQHRAPRIAGVATAVPARSYSQLEVLDHFRITDPKVRSVFLNGGIQRRHLTLPDRDEDGAPVTETQGALLRKHRRLGVDMGTRAVLGALASAGMQPSDVDFLCCVTSTGFLTPGFSALLIEELGLDPGCHRVDVVGMGCNAGLNALNATAGWSAANPGKVAVMVCTEACSAAYVVDSTMRTAVVNSLFGDGAAGLVVRTPAPGETEFAGPQLPEPRILAFASRIITDAIGAMRYDWDDEQNKFSFFLDPAIPYVVGANAESVVDRLLGDAGLRRSDVRHWLVHSGGKKVIDAVRVNLGLTPYDVRHTTGVLRDHGNLSSGSFLFSLQRLLSEEVVAPGDRGVLMTMGPGSTIETALVQW